jgi:hypothetical protein
LSRATHILASAAASAAAGLALAGVGAAAAASCSTIACVEKQVTALTKQLKKDTTALKTANTELTADHKTITALNQCLVEFPLTRYGDTTAGSFGYVFNPGSGGTNLNTTALDVTHTGTSVQAWGLLDGCNASTTLPTGASADRARAYMAGVFGAIAPAAPLTIFSSERP